MNRILLISFILLLGFKSLFAQTVDAGHIETYLWEYPLQENLLLDPDLLDELMDEIDKIVGSGDLFFRPLPNDFADQIWDHYFLYLEPGRILHTVAMAYPYLEPEAQTILRAMVAQLLSNSVHRPWASNPLPLNQGKQRMNYAPERLWGEGSNFGIYRPTIQNVYSLWLYVYRTGDTQAVQPYYNSIRAFYNSKVGGPHDQGRFYGSMSSHVGMARLAQIYEDQDQVIAARSNLTNALNFGLQMNLVDTLARRGTAGWNGAYAYAYESRNVDWVNLNYIFLDLSPEVARYLQQYLQQQTEARHLVYLNRFPLWWLRQAPYFNRWTGDEGIGVPSNSFGINVPLERWFMNRDYETLSSYMLSAPTGMADSYWIEALIMAMESNATDVWVDVRETPFQTDILEDFVWTGSVSNDWHNPANWQNSGVPDAANNVIIPATATNFPTLSAAGECNNLLLSSSALGTASLMGNTFLTVNGTVEVQRYVAGANWNQGADGWHFVSSPVLSQAIAGQWTPSGVENDYDFFAWSDADIPLPWLNQKVPANNLTHFIPGTGYMVAYQVTGIKGFLGTLNIGAVNVNLSRSPGSNWSGWNLLGNPYPSAIDWYQAGRTLFEDNFAYVYNTNRPGGAGYEQIDGSASNALIAPHQGFFVRAGEESHNQTFTFTNELRTHGGAWLKNNQSDDKLSLRISYNNLFDETTLRLREGSHTDRDRYDALKLFSFNPDVPQIYSITSNSIMAAINSIPAIPEERSIAVGIKVSDPGEYAISLADLQGKFVGLDIHLEDIIAGITQNLTENDLYSFHAEAGETSSRFLLKFGEDHSPELPVNLHAYAYGKTLFVLNQTEKAVVEVYNAKGQEVLNKQIGKGLHPIQTALPPGAYFVRMISDNEAASRKVVIH